MRSWLGCWICAAIVAGAGCHDRDRAPVGSAVAAERYEARGRIVAIDGDRVDIHHERLAAIRGWDGKVKPMDSMVMPFTAIDGVSLAGFAPGDPIRFAFEVHYEESPTLRLVKLDRLPASEPLDVK
jgi:Cu/Ag efflux protein CusF